MRFDPKSLRPETYSEMKERHKKEEIDLLSAIVSKHKSITKACDETGACFHTVSRKLRAAGVKINDLLTPDVSIESIIGPVGKARGFTIDDLKSRRQTPGLREARDMAILELRRKKFRVKHIAEFFGRQSGGISVSAKRARESMKVDATRKSILDDAADIRSRAIATYGKGAK